MSAPTGRRRADARPDAVPGRPAVEAPLESRPTGALQRTADTGPDSDAAMTMPRQSRADRRREGLLPAGEDPMVRRPPARPDTPAPAAGRRRSDLPAAAPVPDRRATGERTPAPRTAPPVSGPMTSAAPRPGTPRPAAAASAPATTASPRPTPPAPSAPPPAGSAMPPVARAAGAPGRTAEPAPLPLDVTQRVSGSAPAESAWGTAATTAPPTNAAPVNAAPVDAPSTATPPAAPAPPAAGRSAQPAAVPPVAGRRPATPSPAVPELPAAARAEDDGGPAAPARRAVDVPVGGRAALRLERQAAEAARKKSGTRRPAAEAAPRSDRDDAPAEDVRRGPRRLAQGLVAVAVVALAVLGWWSFASPSTTETSAQTPVPSIAPSPSVSPVQESVAPAPEITPAPVGPVFAPITVLNSTTINGLAADVGDQFAAGGWEVLDTAASPVDDVATTTVYFSEGNTVQQQAATQLVEQFPDVSGPVARYFEVPGVADPGLVVVATGNWQP
ncbi:LytR C-terminal domain-containing protein [uncultured Modestobacter sp.]|uniref:LytR C-terminal domain-containing protein n=1 Tax=uncultured Modestobacter sp. TaxID=380048 RepID=UPI002634C7FB|nr:LytR C-terminal domain-containing protein [uncultured Modestobacter sp.]